VAVSERSAGVDLATGDIAASCADLVVQHRTVAGANVALDNVTTQFERGCFTVIAGPSGSGKSSLLRVLAGLHRPAAGSVVVDGREISRMRPGALRRLRRRTMGIVLQDPADNLIPYLRAVEQLELAAKLRGVDPHEAADLMATVGLADRGGAWPAEMSGGEQQRVAFAAAAIGRPSLLLADEPTAELDAAAAAALIVSMRGLVDRGATLITTSHDASVVAAADRVVTLQDGRVHAGRVQDGRIEEGWAR
jgi:putative ABC transport system ATP-binding protein